MRFWILAQNATHSYAGNDTYEYYVYPHMYYHVSIFITQQGLNFYSSKAKHIKRLNTYRDFQYLYIEPTKRRQFFTCVMVLLWQPVHLDILQSCKCIAPAHHTIKPPGVSPALQLGVRNTFLMALFHCPSLRVMVRIRKWRINWCSSPMMIHKITYFVD